MIDDVTSLTDKRIAGACLYIEKWMDTFKLWYGEERGRQYGQEYFTKVVGYLAIGKLISGNYRECLKAVSAVFDFNKQKFFNIKILGTYFIQLGAKRLLPRKVNQTAKKILGYVGLKFDTFHNRF